MPHLFDRLLQYELDRRKREDRELITGIQLAMADAEAAVECGFIDAGTLAQWRELAADQLQYPADYDRLRYYSGRQLRAHGGPGYAHLVERIAPRLRTAGLGDADPLTQEYRSKLSQALF